MTEKDWDAIAAELGMPVDWRLRGLDDPECMDEMYRVVTDGGAMVCPYPTCRFSRRVDIEAMFRHVHGSAHASSAAEGG